MTKVCLNSCLSYDVDKLKLIVENQFLQLKPEIKPGMTVVIKPNLVIKATAESAVITHPALVAAVGLVVKEMGAKVLIAESSGGPYTPQSTKSIFAACGYTEMAEKYGFQLYTACKNQSVEIANAKICHRINVVEPFVNADYIINIAKLKSHCMTMLSGAVKNLFGTVPGLKKPELHCRFPEKEDFMQMLVDLCQCINPGLSIIDAVQGMEGDGPTGGSPRKIGVIIASKNPYAADFIGAKIANMQPLSVAYLKHAVKRGLLVQEDITLVGDNLESHIQRNFKQPRSKSVDFIDKLPRILRPTVKKITTPNPKVNLGKCTRCGKCAESCPQHVINIKPKGAVINYNECIRCFCCHEMCPTKAIKIARFSLFM